MKKVIIIIAMMAGAFGLVNYAEGYAQVPIIGYASGTTYHFINPATTTLVFNCYENVYPATTSYCYGYNSPGSIYSYCPIQTCSTSTLNIWCAHDTDEGTPSDYYFSVWREYYGEPWQTDYDYEISINYGDWSFKSVFPELCEHTEGYYTDTAEGWIELVPLSYTDIDSVKIIFTSETTGVFYSSTTDFEPNLTSGDLENFLIPYSLPTDDTYQVDYVINTIVYDNVYHEGIPSYVPVYIPGSASLDVEGNMINLNCITRIGSSSVIVGYGMLFGDIPEEATTTSKFQQLVDLVKQRVPFNYVSELTDFLGYLYNPTSTGIATTYDYMFNAADKITASSTTTMENFRVLMSGGVYLFFGFALYKVLRKIGK